MEKGMEDFILKICKSSPDFSTLTIGNLRKQYMQENGLSQMDFKSKKMFSSIVEKILYELVNNSQEFNIEDQEKVNDDQNDSNHVAFSDDEKTENLVKSNDFESSISYFSEESDNDKDNENKLIINENLKVDLNSSSSDNSSVKPTYKKISKYIMSDDSDNDFTMLHIASKEDDISKCGTNNQHHSSEKENVKINNQSKRRKSSDNQKENKIKKQKLDFSSSDDEPLAYLKCQKEDKEDSSRKQNDNEDISSSDRETTSAKTKSKRTKNNKATTAMNSKIEHLKKYIRAAGIRVKSYSKLFENCKTLKSKAEKLMALLEKEGLKGRPNLKKCKKLKAKIERRKEIEELDKSIIITSQGRPKRSLYKNSNNSEQSSSIEKSPQNRFSRLKDIIDSEESD